jgi:hypothetical protein
MARAKGKAAEVILELSSPGERPQKQPKDATDNMTGHTHRAAQTTPHTPTTEGRKEHGRPRSPHDEGGRAVSNGRVGEPGKGASALRDKGPEGGTNLKRAGPRAPCEGGRGETQSQWVTQGQTAVGHEGHRPANRNDPQTRRASQP